MRAHWAYIAGLDGKGASGEFGQEANPVPRPGGGARPLRAPRQQRKDGRELSDTDRKSLRILGLGTDADRRALRQRYADLVRRYHPDRNGGDRTHEKALQQVISAYTQLKSRPAFA